MKIEFLIDYDSKYMHICTTSNKHSSRAAANPALYSGSLEFQSGLDIGQSQPFLASFSHPRQYSSSTQNKARAQLLKFNFSPLCTNYTRKKSYSSATVQTINPTRPGQKKNASLSGETPATNQPRTTHSVVLQMPTIRKSHQNENLRVHPNVLKTRLYLINC